MQNAMIDLMKHFNDNAVNAVKQVSELNLKTFETLTAKQADAVKYCFETGYKNAQAMSKETDPQSAIALQQKTLQAFGEKWSTTARETAEVLTETSNQLTAIAESSSKLVTDSNEKMLELNKQALTDNLAKAAEAIESSVAKSTEMTEEAVTMTQKVVDKVVVMSKENVKKAAQKAAA